MIKFVEFVDRESELSLQNFASNVKSVARSPHFLLFWRFLAQSLDISNEAIDPNSRRAIMRHECQLPIIRRRERSPKRSLARCKPRSRADGQVHRGSFRRCSGQGQGTLRAGAKGRTQCFASQAGTAVAIEARCPRARPARRTRTGRSRRSRRGRTTGRSGSTCPPRRSSRRRARARARARSSSRPGRSSSRRRREFRPRRPSCPDRARRRGAALRPRARCARSDRTPRRA